MSSPDTDVLLGPFHEVYHDPQQYPDDINESTEATIEEAEDEDEYDAVPCSFCFPNRSELHKNPRLPANPQTPAPMITQSNDANNPQA